MERHTSQSSITNQNKTPLNPMSNPKSVTPTAPSAIDNSNFTKISKFLSFNNESLQIDSQIIEDKSNSFIKSPELKQVVKIKRIQVQPLDESIRRTIDDKFAFKSSTKPVNIKRKLLCRQKSLSETNLTYLNHQLYERRRKAQTAVSDPSENNNNEDSNKQHLQSSNVTVDHKSARAGPGSEQQNTSFSESSKDSKLPCVEPNMLLSLYLSRNELPESKLKAEYEMLCYELMYERYLREKYEEYFNKAFAMKTESEQLVQEKVDLVSFNFKSEIFMLKIKFFRSQL